MERYQKKIHSIIDEISKVVVGKEKVVEKVFACILAKGHVLIEDIPGVGKTTLALAISKTMELEHRRMQFTPDVMPSDVVGFTILNKEHELEYKPGAIFTNLFLADEINRTSSKTQSALLEVMEEGNVTVDGLTFEVGSPFTVIATQNPIGSIGTHVLPESQLDRFMIKITMGYPNMQQEIAILKDRQHNNPFDHISKVISKEELMEMQEEVEKIFIHDEIYNYIGAIICATREHSLIELGVSPRGTIALTYMTKAIAFMKGRSFVIPEDVLEVLSNVISHRLILSSKARINHENEETIIEAIIQQIPQPKVK